MVTGTIYNTLRLQTLDQKWQQKKDSGDVLSRKEINERENWTEADWMKHDFEEQLARNREAEKKTELSNKIMSGETLTPEEEEYLEKNDPQTLQKYRQTKAEKKSYEKKLRSCKTKEEVQRLKTNTLSGYLTAFKKIENDPYIPLSEKLAKAQEMLGKSKNIEAAERKFMTTARYRELPTEEELREAVQQENTKEEQSAEKSTETPEEKQTEQPAEGSTEMPEGKQTGQPAEKSTKMPEEKQTEPSAEKSTENTDWSIEIQETYDKIKKQAEPKQDVPAAVGSRVDLVL